MIYLDIKTIYNNGYHNMIKRVDSIVKMHLHTYPQNVCISL